MELLAVWHHFDKFGDVRLNSLLIKYLLAPLFSRKSKEDTYRPKYTQVFLLCLKSNDTQTLKSDSHLPKKKCIICFIESPLKMMKNAFYFISKALFILKIFKFLSWLLGHVGKQLDWKDKVNFRIHDVTSWRSKGDETITFGQLIEYNRRNIFL